MDIAACLILIVLGIPIYFIWRWIGRKVDVDNMTKKVTVWAATIITTPIVYFMLIWLMFFYYPKYDFNKTSWQTNKGERYEISNNIIDSKMLIGKSKKEVIQIMGDEGNMDTSDDWSYNIGTIPKIGNIDPSNLNITFKDGKVIEVTQR